MISLMIFDFLFELANILFFILIIVVLERQKILFCDFNFIQTVVNAFKVGNWPRA